MLAPVHAEPADEMDDAPSVDAARVRTREAIASHGRVDGFAMCQRIDAPAGVVLP
jgi:hypothetical protein